MKLEIKKIVGVVALLLAVISYLIPGSVVNTALGGQSQTVGRFSSIGEKGVSTGVVVTTSGVQVLATSSAREYAEISNLSAFAIYCNADADKRAVMYQGIMIPASTTKVFGADFAYTGAIRCISQANASTTVYAEQ